jgi:hypothetical protein
VESGGAAHAAVVRMLRLHLTASFGAYGARAIGVSIGSIQQWACDRGRVDPEQAFAESVRAVVGDRHH